MDPSLKGSYVQVEILHTISVHLSTTSEKSNMDEEPLMGFGDMKTKPSDVSSYSYGNISKASQMSSMRGLIELSGAKPR
jgi:hypothetical protein